MPKKPNKKSSEKNAGNRETFKGKLEITRGGMGFVIVTDMEKDILVKRENLGTALNGDEVEVETRGYKDNNRRIEGYVTRVVTRKQTEFAGVIQVHPHFAFLIPDSEKMGVDIYIPLNMLKGAKDGDKAVARITEWTSKTKNPVGEVVTILNNESINEIAMQGILMENGFPLVFPDEVIEESERISGAITADEMATRRDFRQTLTITIDPADARDFDDAISFKELKDGYFEVGVHIADVSHFIVQDSALDKEAYRRATSVYLPDRVLPMLPERLSNELCSLRPNEEKYTFSAVFVINKDGKIKEHWLGKTIIRSQRRYAYEEVQTIIETKEGDYANEVLQLNELSQNLRKARFKKGAINFSSQEVRFKLDDTGKPIGIVIKESKESHQLIEELMLLANKTVAEYVGGVKFKDKELPFPYRVHDVPDEEKLRVFSSFASRFGVSLDLSSPGKISSSFNLMLASVNGKPEQHVLEQLGIRTMAKAIYTTENIGHYGLGFAHYCHFTSPIRRYPDVLVHRILHQCIEAKLEPIKQLEAQCRHCSEQERHAMEAERTANKYKQVEYMKDYIGEDFEAVISGVSTFGFWAETVAHKCEGMVSIADLQEFDNFEFIEHDYALIGRKTGIKFSIGDDVMVKVVSANLDRRRIDYSLVALPKNLHNDPIGKKKKAPSVKAEKAMNSSKSTTKKRK